MGSFRPRLEDCSPTSQPPIRGVFLTSLVLPGKPARRVRPKSDPPLFRHSAQEYRTFRISTLCQFTGCAAVAVNGSWCGRIGMRWRPRSTARRWSRRCGRCDNPVCVRVSRPGGAGLLHVVGGSQRDNMVMMARARRGGGRPAIRRRGAGVAARRARAGFDGLCCPYRARETRRPHLWCECRRCWRERARRPAVPRVVRLTRGRDPVRPSHYDAASLCRRRSPQAAARPRPPQAPWVTTSELWDDLPTA